MQAVVTAPRAAQTHNLHRAGGRFGVAFVLVRLRALDTAGVLGRTSSLFRAALVAMSLQELAYQILAPPVQFPFEFALAHLPGFAGREEGFGIREDSIGRCARGSAREIDARDAGSRHVAGLDADRYSWTAVLHREQGGGVHVHVLTARCDLETGRSLNIAPPGWQKTFDPLRDAFNHEHGWNRPDDPARARAQQPGHRAYIEAANLRTGLEHEADARELIRDYLTQRVEHGAVQSRADVVAALEEARLEVTAPGQELPDRPESGRRQAVAAEGSVVRA